MPLFFVSPPEPVMPRISCNFDREFTFDATTTALLAIDMQRDFLEDGGYCAAAGGDISSGQAIIPSFGRVLAAARQAGLRIIHTREGYLADGSDMSAMKRERNSAGTQVRSAGSSSAASPARTPYRSFIRRPAKP